MDSAIRKTRMERKKSTKNASIPKTILRPRVASGSDGLTDRDTSESPEKSPEQSPDKNAPVIANRSTNNTVPSSRSGYPWPSWIAEVAEGADYGARHMVYSQMYEDLLQLVVPRGIFRTRRVFMIGTEKIRWSAMEDVMLTTVDTRLPTLNNDLQSGPPYKIDTLLFILIKHFLRNVRPEADQRAQEMLKIPAQRIDAESLVKAQFAELREKGKFQNVSKVIAGFAFGRMLSWYHFDVESGDIHPAIDDSDAPLERWNCNVTTWEGRDQIVEKSEEALMNIGVNLDEEPTAGPYDRSLAKIIRRDTAISEL